MLTRSVYVRKLIPTDPELYSANPNEYTGEWERNEEGEVGEIVSEHFIPVPDPASPGMVKMTPLVGVVWDETTLPAIMYETLALLERVEIEEDEEEEEDSSDSDSLEEEVAPIGI
jgi:hypothetical protein